MAPQPPCWRRAAAALAVLTAALVAAQKAPLPAACDVASVGGGWAGVYFAWRMATAGHKVCVFEASHRVGGRTYSHKLEAGSPPEQYTLDVGAYRFSPDMHLPGDVITKVLKLPVACYEPSCPPASMDFPPPFHFNYSAPLVRIVDDERQPAGYVEAIEGLVARIVSLGGNIFYDATLTDASLISDETKVRLSFGDRVVVADQVLLNLPRPVLLGLPSLRAQTPPRTTKAQECVKFDLPTAMFPPGKMTLGRSLTKAYAFYEEAWWHTRLNQTEGQLPENAFEPMNTSQGIPIGIHFNDGPVRCDAPLKGCRGFLEVFYSTVDETFFEDLQPSPGEPLGVLTEEVDGSGRLARLHAAIMEATDALFAKRGAVKPPAPPTMLVVGVWHRGASATQGYTAPTKVYYSADPSVPGGPDPLDKACGLDGLTEEEYRQSVLTPVRSHRILVANNDWVAQTTETLFGDWAEESLLQAERGLRRLGVPKPYWLDAAYYEAKVVRFAPVANVLFA